ncbi:HxlR family transcriptional regulator [Asanoa ishikariensis]|uniref:Transcriptional regulator, HxlR family n=1 Tax=Asanoa ishikariensis TaxID=137265 RepID=A0A1H3UYH2_9ACTN|nr:helix-turn-helix domain-containing protein [Asanoa ishikariensis]GIF70034.1 HxlR family transcriptional regulator [Asanoa ishikariensis]SDZ67346.1 transcriptional regulator, HxlR family [Asanoa ishikariensis]
MPIKRSYGEHGDACRAANALDLVGDRWTLILVRELILGPKRFADLQESVRGITPAVLADRLRFLREAGIVEQVVLADLARTHAYAATEWGRGLEPVLAALGQWFSAGPDPSTSGGMTPDGIVVAMRTMGAADSNVALRLYDERRSDPPVHTYDAGTPAAATVTSDSTVWSEILFGGLALGDAERDHGVVVEGDRAAVVRLVRGYASAGDE